MTTAFADPSPRPDASRSPPDGPPPEVAALLGDAAAPTPRRDSATTSLALAVFGVFLITLPYLPLGLALLEHLTLGTNQVEGLCRELEVHDDLGRLYEATFFWLR